MMRRRKLIQSAGAALLTTTVIGSSSATSDQPKVSQYSGGLSQEEYDEIMKLVSKGEIEKAVDEVEKTGVKHDHDQTQGIQNQSDGSDSSDGPGGGIKPDDYFDKNKSNTNLFSAYIGDNSEGNEVHVISMNVEPYVIAPITECPLPKDRIAITWSSDLWEYEPGNDYTGTHASNITSSPTGVKADFDDSEEWNDADSGGDMYEPTTTINTAAEKTETGSHNIYGHWVHNWRPGCLPGGMSIALAYGSVSVTPSGGTDYWKVKPPVIEI